LQEVAAAGISARGITDLTCDNYEVLARTAERSDIVVLGPVSILKHYIDAGRMVPLGEPLAGPQVKPALLWCERRPLSPAAQALMASFN
jgi:DNA-binding transcriptional LysR family regulator